METTEATKLVKKALAEKYGARNVSVRRGRGTACGWIHATVTVPRESDRDEVYREANRLAKQSGAEFSHYYSDDGSDYTPYDCFLLQVDYQSNAVAA